MNDIFKLFKKRSQSGKSTNLNEFLQEFNDKDLPNASNFDRTNRSYISISKSGRVKSKKSHNTTRSIKDDIFQPNQQQQQQQPQTQYQQPQLNIATSSAATYIQSKNSSVPAASMPTPGSSHSKNSSYYHQNNSRFNCNIKPQNVYDQHSDNADSSRTSSASQSSFEDLAYNTSNKSTTNNNSNVNNPTRSAYNFPFGNSRNHRH